MNSTDRHLQKSSLHAIQDCNPPSVFLTLNIDRYDPDQVKAWGYYFYQTQGHTLQNPIPYYTHAGGLPELYPHFEAGVQDAIGHTVLHTLRDIATKEGVSYRYIHAEQQHGRLKAFNVGGVWLVRHYDYARWLARRHASLRVRRKRNAR